MTVPRIGGAPAPSLEQQHAQLRRAAHQLEGVFMTQLFQAMRGSESASPEVSGGSAGEMFRGLLDEKIAEEAALKSTNGIGEALYRQLSRHLAPLPATPSAVKGE